MNTDEVLVALENVDDLLSDFRLAAQIAQDNGTTVDEEIRNFTHRDPNLLGAVLNLAALIKP